MNMNDDEAVALGNKVIKGLFNIAAAVVVLVVMIKLFACAI